MPQGRIQRRNLRKSEMVSLVADGIVKGLHAALSSRVAALAATLPEDGGVFMSDGVALNPAMVEALAAAFGRRVPIVPERELVGAVGAALAV